MNIMYVMKRIEQTGNSKGGKMLKAMPSQIFFYDEAGRAMWESVFGLENSLVEWNRFVKGLCKYLSLQITLKDEMMLQRVLGTYSGHYCVVSCPGYAHSSLCRHVTRRRGFAVQVFAVPARLWSAEGLRGANKQAPDRAVVLRLPVSPRGTAAHDGPASGHLHDAFLQVAARRLRDVIRQRAEGYHEVRPLFVA